MGWLTGGDLGGSQGGDSKYPKREIHRGNSKRGHGLASEASKKGWGTRRVTRILKADAKSQKKYGSKGLKDRGGKGGAADGLDRWG